MKQIRVGEVRRNRSIRKLQGGLLEAALAQPPSGEGQRKSSTHVAYKQTGQRNMRFRQLRHEQIRNLDCKLAWTRLRGGRLGHDQEADQKPRKPIVQVGFYRI